MTNIELQELLKKYPDNATLYYPAFDARVEMPIEVQVESSIHYGHIVLSFMGYGTKND